MKSNITKRTLTHMATGALAVAMLAATGAAFAAGGVVSGVSVAPMSVYPNDIVSLKVNISQGSVSVDCNMRWSMLDSNNVEIKSGGGRITAPQTTAVYAVQFGAPAHGVYTVKATNGMPSGQAVVCTGMATTTLTVMDKSVRVAPGTVVSQVPHLELAPVPTLTSIKQVPYTDQGVETWIGVEGTGICSFTIEGAGMAPQSFTSSAASPFPMKVKMQGAPIGSHLWTAKGTGKCTGNAQANITVNG